MPKRLLRLSRWTVLDRAIIFSVSVFVICLLSWIAYANAFTELKLQEITVEVAILEYKLQGGSNTSGITEKQFIKP